MQWSACVPCFVICNNLNVSDPLDFVFQSVHFGRPRVDAPHTKVRFTQFNGFIEISCHEWWLKGTHDSQHHFSFGDSIQVSSSTGMQCMWQGYWVYELEGYSVALYAFMECGAYGSLHARSQGMWLHFIVLNMCMCILNVQGWKLYRSNSITH